MQMSLHTVQLGSTPYRLQMGLANDCRVVLLPETVVEEAKGDGEGLASEIRMIL